MKKNALYILVIFLYPVSALAAAGTVREFILDIVSFVNFVIPVIVSIALLVFFWGLAKFIYNVGSEDVIEEGRQLMLWGLIALFVMVSVWGILRLAYGELGFSQPFRFMLLPE